MILCDSYLLRSNSTRLVDVYALSKTKKLFSLYVTLRRERDLMKNQVTSLKRGKENEK